MEPSTPSRRRLLGLLGAGVTGTLAGCNDAFLADGSDTATEAPPVTRTRAITPTATVTPTPTPTSTETATPTPTPETAAADEQFSTESGEKAFGTSLALSADGKTAAVGSLGFNSTHTPGDPGAGYVFERTDEGWQRLATLSYPGDDDPSGADEDDEGTTFGSPIALSGDGTRCLVGDSLVGEVYVYDRSGDGLERTATLPDDGSQEGFGDEIDVAADGETVAVLDMDGVHVFARQEDGWRAETVLSAGDAVPENFVEDVAISGDGETLLVGATDGELTDDEVGGAYVYQRNGGEWGGRRALAPDEDAGHADYGGVVALSPDGRTALVGARDRTDAPCSIRTTTYIFGATDGEWRRESRLESMCPYDSAAVSSAGSALVGNEGPDHADGPLASVLRPEGDWRRTATLVAPDDVEWSGRSTALSADGSTALVGRGIEYGDSGPPTPVYVFDL